MTQMVEHLPTHKALSLPKKKKRGNPMALLYLYTFLDLLRKRGRKRWPEEKGRH
jgi:hypothetical protein